ncbi:MAG: hypothetical protein ABEN55_20795 [Bradymonadaceae bacterium]
MKAKFNVTKLCRRVSSGGDETARQVLLGIIEGGLRALDDDEVGEVRKDLLHTLAHLTVGELSADEAAESIRSYLDPGEVEEELDDDSGEHAVGGGVISPEF